jgi:hypothetical protein
VVAGPGVGVMGMLPGQPYREWSIGACRCEGCCDVCVLQYALGAACRVARHTVGCQAVYEELGFNWHVGEKLGGCFRMPKCAFRANGCFSLGAWRTMHIGKASQAVISISPIKA